MSWIFMGYLCIPANICKKIKKLLDIFRNDDILVG